MKKTKLFHSIIAFTLILSILFSLFVFGPVTLSATAEESNTNPEEIEYWDGKTTADSFADGDGSVGNPYQIENGAQLRLLVTSYCSADYESSYFKLTKDIYLNEVADDTHVKSLADKNNWADGLTAGSKANSFYGTLDGDGHTIYGLYAYGEEAVLGLFPGINSATVVKNLNFDNLYINGARSSGAAIAGVAYYYTWQKTAQISNCSVINAVIGQNQNMEFAAGLVADTHEVKVSFTNCYSHSNTFSDWTTGAGFVANDWDDGATTYNNCYSAGAYPVSAAVNKATISNVYTNVLAPEGTVATGIVTLDDDQMKGTAAKTYMAGFDFALTWKTVEGGYPVFSDIEVWDGTSATNYAGGSGTKADPYLIENGAQLLKMVKDSTATTSDASSVTNNYFKIVNDIYLNPVTAEDMAAPTVDAWKAKGYTIWDGGYRWSQSTGFCGTIDGDGHTIYGLYVDSGCYSGFLANVVGNATVTNLHFKNAFVRGASNGCSPAVIIGAVNGNSTVRSTATVTNCTVDNGYVFSDHTGSWRNGIVVGGGFNEGKITVSNCAVTNSRGVITNTSTEKRTAAFIGNTNYTKTHLIENCFTDSSMHPVTDATTEANYKVIHDNKIYKNVYTSAAPPSWDTNGDITYLNEEDMKGDNAKTYMPGLSYRFVWETVENGYPVINLRGELWDGPNGYVVSSYDDFDGEGTKESPYLIENGDQLYFAAIDNSNLTDGSYYKLVRDIVLNDTSVADWEASAKLWGMNKAKRFNGTLDGDGHTIEGLYINVNSTDGRYGLFSYVGQDTSVSDKVAEIKNITIKGASVTNTTTSSFEGVGIVAGQASGETVFENIYIDENCKVNAPAVKGVAGIIARSNQNVTITNCAVHGTYTGGSHVGSFLGTFWGGKQTISNSYSAANVPVTTSRTPTVVNTYATVKMESEATRYDSAVVLLTEEEMKGDNALTYMVGFDFDFMWKIVENGYPVLRDMADRLPAWSGDIATTLKGDGTKANPFKISNGAELYYAISTYSNQDYATLIENKPYFELTSDINLANQQWYNVGTTSYPSSTNFATGFAGVIYGNGHTIYNLKNAASVSVAGLIPVATQGTEIYDLHLVNGELPKVVWNTYVGGGLIGLAVATKNSTPITISGCSVKNYEIGSRDGSAAFVGDTYSQSLIIKDCYAVNNTISHTVDETATRNTGAFVGIVDGNGKGNSIVIKNSYTDGDADIGYVKEMSTTFNNVYTTLDSYLNNIDGLSKVTAAKITGDTAKSNLNGFNFNQIWKVVEDSTPVHFGMDYRANYFSGTAADTFAGGTGSVEDPYIIKTADQLYLLANLDRDTTYGKYYKLANDITISDTSYTNWQEDDPFTWAVKKAYLAGFTYTSSFAGTLDGAGYTVSGLYYNNAIVDGGNYAYGLIPFVTADAVIKNITVSDTYATVQGKGAYVGAVAGAAHVMYEDIEANKLHAVQFVGVNVNNATIGAENINNKGDILGGASYGVKFDLCKTANNIHGTIQDYYVENNCNNSSPYRKDVVVVNNITAKDTFKTVRKVLIGADKTTYISSIDMTAGNINVCDLFAAKKGMVAEKPVEYLVWSDEFNNGIDDIINKSVWTEDTTMSKGTTLEYANTATFDGEAMALNCYDTGRVDANGNTIYNVSYGLTTKETMSFKYGRLEMRAKVPFGAGAFPSLWLTSRNALGNGVSPYGYDNEVDIFEVFGKTAGVDNMVTCLHKWYVDENGTRTGDECSSGSGILDGNLDKVEQADRDYQITGAAQDEFHTIVFEWTADTMTFSVDGNVYYTAIRSDLNDFDINGYETDSAGLFNQFMYVRLNNHMYTVGAGAPYTYNGNASEINPEDLSYEIDYIRLYQDNNGEINLK